MRNLLHLVFIGIPTLLVSMVTALIMLPIMLVTFIVAIFISKKDS